MTQPFMRLEGNGWTERFKMMLSYFDMLYTHSIVAHITDIR